MASGAEVFGRTRSLAFNARLKPFVLGGVAVAALVVGVWYAAQVIVLDHVASAALDASVAHATAPLRPEATVQVSVRGAGVELQSARLVRQQRDDGAPAGGEQAVPVRLQPAEPGTWQVVPADASTLLQPDGDYKLTLRIVAPRPALPVPRTDVVERQYRFSTVASPHLKLPSAELRPRWAEPVSLSWSLPMQDLTVTSQPAASVRAWVDQNDPTRTWVQLGGEAGAGLQDGQTYTLQITNARSEDGLTLQRPASVSVAVPPRPRFVDAPSQPVPLRFGETLTLTASTDLANAQVQTTGDLPTRVVVDKKQIRLELPDYRQGAAFDLNVTSATSTQGAPLSEPLRVHVQTPPAFGAPTTEPEDGTRGVAPSIHPAIIFPEPVADQTAATAALWIQPAVSGHWEWTAPNRVEFVPDARLPVLTHFDMGVRGGPSGPRTAAGGYLDNDITAAFRTTHYKRIDVSLGRQMMTLYENEVPVRTIYVATGVAAAPTPTGTFEVQYKMPQARFRGVNPDGSHYDIPDVHWVMPFLGDYTIHGAYWRARYGTPGSDGCVSMPDADAKVVYDWADVGTPVTIHS